MDIEILVIRDPDGDTHITVFADGVNVTNIVQIEDVDPGRGYTREDWEEATERVRTDPELTEPFRALTVAMRDEWADNEYILD